MIAIFLQLVSESIIARRNWWRIMMNHQLWLILSGTRFKTFFSKQALSLQRYETQVVNILNGSLRVSHLRACSQNIQTLILLDPGILVLWFISARSEVCKAASSISSSYWMIESLFFRYESWSVLLLNLLKQTVHEGGIAALCLILIKTHCWVINSWS